MKNQPQFPLGLWLLVGSLCTGLPWKPAPRCHTGPPRTPYTWGPEMKVEVDYLLENWDKACVQINRWHAPLLKRVDYVWKLIGAEVTTYAAVHLHLLVPLVQFALDDVTVNSLDQQVLQFSHIL